MSYRGDYRAGDTIDFKFATVNTSAAPTTLSGTPVASVYKSNSTTESTAGVTLTVDFDSRTGLNHVRITTGSDGTFYADGNDFDVILTAGTVGGASVVGMVVGSFSLSNRSALRPATAGRNVVVDAAGLVDANAVKVGPTGAGTAQTAGDIVTDILGLPTLAQIGDEVWDEPLAGHLTAGSTGAALNSAGSAGDPWATALPGAYGAGLAGNIVGNNLNATVSSRSQPGDNMGVTSAGADAILDRSNGVESGFTLRQACRLMLSALAAKLSGAATTTVTIRDVNDAKNRITATVDSSGDRTAVTYNVS